MKKFKISIAGLGNVGSYLLKNLIINKEFILEKGFDYDIIGVSAKNKNKQRIVNLDEFNWFENPLDLIEKSNPNILIELIGTEKGISYELIKLALKNKVHVVTANKALLANHGNELFNIADDNNVLLLFEAAVAGGIPIIKSIKQSLSLSKIKKISGIFNGTTNYILSEMLNKNINFNEALQDAQNLGFAESDPKNDIEGIDSAHKLTILSVLCFGVKFNFSNVIFKGISGIDIDDINFSKKLGYKLKLLCSAEIKNDKILSIIEPTLVKINSKLANVNGVQNGIKIETDYMDALFFEGEGAGGKATSSSIISDLFEIFNKSENPSLGFKANKLVEVEQFDYKEKKCSYYIRITVKDIPGVLAKITSLINQAGISIQTIFQLPKNDNANSNNQVPVIITTHETTFDLLNSVIKNIKDLEFVISKIIVISIDKNIN